MVKHTPPSFQGPDIWVQVRLLEAGLFRVSFYLYNVDGHASANRQRDWPVEVYAVGAHHRQSLTIPPLADRTCPNNAAALRWMDWALSTPPLAACRIGSTSNPAYIRFAVAGPGQYMFRIDRNASLNAELSGAFVDRADAARTAFDNRAMTGFGGVDYCPPKLPKGYTKKAPEILTVWNAAKHSFGPSGILMRETVRLMCYRYALAHDMPPALLARMRWRLDIWTHQDRLRFDKMMNRGFWAYLKGWKGLRQFLVKGHEWAANAGRLGHG